MIEDIKHRDDWSLEGDQAFQDYFQTPENRSPTPHYQSSFSGTIVVAAPIMVTQLIFTNDDNDTNVDLSKQIIFR